MTIFWKVRAWLVNPHLTLLRLHRKFFWLSFYPTAIAVGKLAHSYYKLFFHLVWHTKNNLPYLEGKTKDIVFEHIKAVCNKYEIKILSLNCTEIHVHLLIQVRKWISITDLIWEIKGKSSFEIKKYQNLNLSWQTGYSIFSVSVGSRHPWLRRHLTIHGHRKKMLKKS